MRSHVSSFTGSSTFWVTIMKREERKKKSSEGWRRWSVIGSAQAKELIRVARKAVAEAFEGREFIPEDEFRRKYSEKRGVFITILTHPRKELRGCIGVPYPVMPLWQAVIHSALSSAFKDPRFQPLKREELDKVIFELSILTVPEEIDKGRLFEEVRIGSHGLIVEKGSAKGLLLPQVAVKYGWDPREFVENTCLKAGLSRECWKEKDVKIYRFSGEVYEEVEPWGEVLRI